MMGGSFECKYDNPFKICLAHRFTIFKLGICSFRIYLYNMHEKEKGAILLLSEGSRGHELGYKDKLAILKPAIMKLNDIWVPDSLQYFYFLR